VLPPERSRSGAASFHWLVEVLAYLRQSEAFLGACQDAGGMASRVHLLRLRDGNLRLLKLARIELGVVVGFGSIGTWVFG
jgi:hypothetical protein